MLHSFKKTISHTALPEKFTYPFCYTPHPLCILASEEIHAYLETQVEWKEELQRGKMFGVLIVRTLTGETGYLAAFSGNLAGKNVHSHFVPPVYDLSDPQGFFKVEEEKISALNARIHALRTEPRYLECREKEIRESAHSKEQLAQAKTELKVAKEAREIRRKNHPGETELNEMIRESQSQKAEFKRLERHWKEHLASLQAETERFITEIEHLKTERKIRSATLQQQLFEQFRFLNARGEIRTLDTLFRETAHKVPPAGAGECAAPKLLQYAYLHGLHPIAMAEFWRGNSPKTEMRRHGYFYPACKGKCEPILRHMLQGLEMEENPLLRGTASGAELEIRYEDEWLLVVHKPEGLLSVPGKTSADSVFQRIKQQYPEATGPLIVHRLDMSTSGLLLVAKTKEIHQNLQAQFKNRTIRKRYIALLDGIVTPEEGCIDLPLCLDPFDRPRQIVSDTHGKRAHTKYKVLGRPHDRTRIAFYPLTGRTHQLRVHAAHPLGLNSPITGDMLYGQKAERLYLHAEYLEFRHPVSGKSISVERKADF